MDRRHFLILGATFAAGCALPRGGGAPGASPGRAVNAGPASQYLADGVYARFRDRGFFIVRQGANLFALSAICTHRRCKLDAEPDQTFVCPCHGSTFAANGKVTTGPARRDLPAFSIATDKKGDLLVALPPS